jgi:arylsulfatase A
VYYALAGEDSRWCNLSRINLRHGFFPYGLALDGRTPARAPHRLWPLLSGQPGAKTPHDVFFHYQGSELQAIRSGKWKLHFPHTYRHVVEPGKDGVRGTVDFPEVPLSLYDLEKDPGESINLADQHPEVIERLMPAVEKMRHTLGDGITKTKGVEIRPCGQHEK